MAQTEAGKGGGVMKKPKSLREMKRNALSRHPSKPPTTEHGGDELITVNARITLTRAEWARSMQSVEMAAICQAIGMSSVSTAEKVLAQVIATGNEVKG